MLFGFLKHKTMGGVAQQWAVFVDVNFCFCLPQSTINPVDGIYQPPLATPEDNTTMPTQTTLPTGLAVWPAHLFCGGFKRVHICLSCHFASWISACCAAFTCFGWIWKLWYELNPYSCLDSSQVCKSDQRPSTLPVGPVVTVMGSLQTPTPNSTGGSSAV